MKLNIPTDVFKSALTCAAKDNKDKKGCNALFFEFGETHYRIISTDTHVLFIAELPYTDADEIDDGDFSSATIENLPKKIAGKSFAVEFLGDKAKINDEEFTSNPHHKILDLYRRVFPHEATTLSEGYPFILKGVATSISSVIELLGVEYKVYPFGRSNPFVVEFSTDFPCVLIAMPAVNMSKVTPEGYADVKAFVDDDIKEW